MNAIDHTLHYRHPSLPSTENPVSDEEDMDGDHGRYLSTLIHENVDSDHETCEEELNVSEYKDIDQCSKYLISGYIREAQKLFPIDDPYYIIPMGVNCICTLFYAALDTEQKSKLSTFMDFVDAEKEPSVRYLRDAAWDLQIAMDNFFREHPDHVNFA